MKLFSPIRALLQGFRICFSHKEIFRLCLWPWTLGAICSLLSVLVAIPAHANLLQWLVGEPTGLWTQLLYYIAWLLVALSLLLCSMLLSLLIVFAMSAAFQTAIATHVLKLQGVAVASEPSNAAALFKETVRNITSELLKLLWILPLGICVLILGFIPILLPLALVIGAWLLAYQFVDVPLDVLKMSVSKRLGFALRHSLQLVLFGFTLGVFWAVPLLGLLLPPVAVAGATWLLAENKLIERNQSELEGVK